MLVDKECIPTGVYSRYINNVSNIIILTKHVLFVGNAVVVSFHELIDYSIN